ncbi:MAG: sigma-70 family RNA polymerase sigma factor [Butyrivibrio sp.]|nr:sigma-70 family RNA polymerase sigma factor [Butyrivibrio sp.]
MSDYALRFERPAERLLFDTYSDSRNIKALVKRVASKIFLFANIADDIKASAKEQSDSAIGSACERAGQIIDIYGDKVLRLAYSYVHNMSDAEDILQDTLIQYMKAAPSFENAEHEKAWILRVAANISKNKIKYNNYRETDELMEELVAEDEEDLSFVWDAVKQLPEKYREVTHLFYEEGYSTAEIAKVLDRKEATVRSDLLRGREKLKTILKEAYDFE